MLIKNYVESVRIGHNPNWPCIPELLCFSCDPVLTGRKTVLQVSPRHIIENDPQLHSIWPNPRITAYRKTKSLKDILIHSSQAKSTPLSSATNKHQQL